MMYLSTGSGCCHTLRTSNLFQPLQTLLCQSTQIHFLSSADGWYSALLGHDEYQRHSKYFTSFLTELIQPKLCVCHRTGTQLMPGARVLQSGIARSSLFLGYHKMILHSLQSTGRRSGTTRHVTSFDILRNGDKRIRTFLSAALKISSREQGKI